MKRHLDELYSRRNVIAHQTDRTHTNAQINSITKEIVQEFMCDVEKVVKAIDTETRSK